MTEPLRLTEQDDGRTLEVRVGQAIAISLPENASTGYRWTIERIAPDIVAAQDPQPRPGSHAVGAAGRLDLVLLPQAPGIASITLRHWRPWDGDRSIVGRFHLSLRVAP